MIDLFPEEVMERLRQRFGKTLDRLTHSERVALALATSEATVNHSRLRAVTAEHRFDLSRTPRRLTQAGLLKSSGYRGANYHLPTDAIPSPDDEVAPQPSISASSSLNLADQRDPVGCLISEQLALPVVGDLEMLSQALRSRMESIASEPRSKGKVDRKVLIDVVLQLCEGRFVTLRCLEELVNRKPDTLRDQYFNDLVRQR